MRIDLSDRFYRKAWVAWVAAFVVLEGLALLDKSRGDTFSERWLWRLPREVTLTFVAWLGLHAARGNK